MPQEHEAIVEEAIADYEEAAEKYLGAFAAEARVADQGPELKHQLITKLLGTDNPLTGKPHTATSAADALAMHTTWGAHVSSKRSATTTRLACELQMRVAYLRALAAVNASPSERPALGVVA